MESVKFGPSGWQGLLADDFTIRNVRIVCQGIAQYLRHEKIGQRGVIIGYDARFMGERFTQVAAEVMAAHGIPSLICDRDTPASALSFHILHHQLAGGINISAGHHPSEYNGIYFIPSWGGPAPTETSEGIEQRIVPLLHGDYIKWLPWERAKAEGMVRIFDPKPDYLAELANHIDSNRVRESGLRVVMDPLYGTTRGYLDEFLRQAGAKLAVLHHWRDPYFGGLRPEPTPETLVDLQTTVRSEEAHLGLATDGYGHRFAVVDADGTIIEPNYVLALLVDYLVQSRNLKGGIARSVATTHLIDAVAAAHGLTVHETPVGFQFIGELLARGQAVLGVEESAGLSIQGHVPSKDAILACALVTEMVAHTGKTLQALLEELFLRVGPLYGARKDILADESVGKQLEHVLETPPDSFAGLGVTQVNKLDGCKLLLEDGSWFLFRRSTRKPWLRCYAESHSKEQLETLMSAGRSLLSLPT